MTCPRWGRSVSCRRRQREDYTYQRDALRGTIPPRLLTAEGAVHRDLLVRNILSNTHVQQKAKTHRSTAAVTKGKTAVVGLLVMYTYVCGVVYAQYSINHRGYIPIPCATWRPDATTFCIFTQDRMSAVSCQSRPLARAERVHFLFFYSQSSPLPVFLSPSNKTVIGVTTQIRGHKQLRSGVICIAAPPPTPSPHSHCEYSRFVPRTLLSRGNFSLFAVMKIPCHTHHAYSSS